MSTGKNSTTQKTKKISMQLLMILIPMIALFIIAVAVIIFINARTIIIKDGKTQLQEESAANANDIGRTMDNIKGYYNGLSDIIETSQFDKKDDILKALEPGMKEYEGFVIDCYAAFSDKSFYDGGG